jgi:glycosyltransferase involved in cell wall biosynthesis
MNICFVSLNAWSILSNDQSRETTVGGAELQVVILARELVQRGHQVSIIVMDHGQPQESEVQGIRVLSAYRPNEGLSGLRFFHPRLTKLWSALSRAGAEIYFQSGAGAMTGIVAVYAMLHRNTAFVFRAASNADFAPDLPLVRYARDRQLFRWGIRRANLVFVQTTVQQQLLRERFSLDSFLLPNAIEPAQDREHQQEHISDAMVPFVLWAGRLIDLKRPDRYLTLARSLPHLKFILVGANTSELKRWLASKNLSVDVPTNLYPMGLVPMAKVDDFFKRAALLVNTSDIEGFPNTFIQAWRCSVPTVSFFDAQVEVGHVVADDPTMAVVVEELMKYETTRFAEGKRCFDYYQRRHKLEQVAIQLEARLNQLLG